MRSNHHLVCDYGKAALIFLLVPIFLVRNVPVDAWQPSSLTAAGPARSTSPSSVLVLRAAAKGFGAAPSNKATKKPNKKQILKQLEKTYGGTTPQDIARATQLKIDASLQSQPPHIQMAIQIYQRLQRWNHQLDGMTVLQQTKIPVEDMEGAKRAQAELERLMQEHEFTQRDLHNLLQKATWDASADAKAARSITGEMPADIQKRVQAGCDVAVQRAQETAGDVDKVQVLDVGCGFGVLVPFLRKAGLQDDQIHGIDLSPEMIRNAQQWYPQCHLEAADFYSYEPSNHNINKFDALIFCSSLHDLPDMMSATLPKARNLLRPDGGTLVILHPQGASHVQNQVRSNPTMVPRGLPTTEELQSLAGFRLIQEPASPQSTGRII
jgi:2-polyprenyl-3-methyl-5-hydroxy-6-metoxy-1,4-benzoquinol methylase